MKKFIYIFTFIALIFNACTKDFFLVDSLETNVKKTETISEDNSNKNNSSENGSNENTSQQNSPEPKSFINVYQDSIYVYTLNSGLLYPLFKSAVTGKETNDEWGEEVWDSITGVKIVGCIDARDFSTLKWNFRNLKNLDISETNIIAYKGIYGTVEGYEYEYNANAIPLGAFFYWQSNFIREFPSELFDEGMPSLKHIKMPSNIKCIERNAFARAYNLEDIEVPEGVVSINMCAFRHCHSIKKMYIPKSVQTIGFYAFTDMNSLTEIYFKSKVLPNYDKTAFGFYYDGTNTDYFNEMWYVRGYIMEGDNTYLKYNDVTLYVPKGCKNVYKEWDIYFKNVEEYGKS